MACIFVYQPPYCSEPCLNSRKLQCLRDSQQIKVSEEGKAELRELLEADMNSVERIKDHPGQSK